MLAEGVGFEPTLRFPVNTLSKRAPSATRPPLQRRREGARKTNPRHAPKARWCAFSHSATPPACHEGARKTNPRRAPKARWCAFSHSATLPRLGPRIIVVATRLARLPGHAIFTIFQGLGGRLRGSEGVTCAALRPLQSTNAAHIVSP